MTIGTKAILYGVGALVVLMIAIAVMPFTQIDPGEMGIVLRLGKIDRVLPSGFHYVTPLVENVEKINTQVQVEKVSASAASKDLQSIDAVVAVNYALEGSRVSELYSTIGKEYKIKVIDPSVQEAVKAATAKYTAEESITKREQVKDEIKRLLIEGVNAKAPGLIHVTDVSIVNFEFSAGFNASIEAKVKAEQDALTAKNKLAQVEFEAQQRVATAEAEAKSIRLQSDAANNEKYVSLKALEVQLEFAKHWNGQYPSTYIVNGSGANGPIQVIPLPAVK